MPIVKEGAIQGYAKQQEGSGKYIIDKIILKQLLVCQGTYLVSEMMTECVFFLSKNYRVQCKKFREFLHHVRLGKPTKQETENILKLHMTYHKSTNEDFIISKVTTKQCMCSQKNQKNNDKFVEMSQEKKAPVVRLEFWHNANKLQSKKQQHTIILHFDKLS